MPTLQGCLSTQPAVVFETLECYYFTGILCVSPSIFS